MSYNTGNYQKMLDFIIGLYDSWKVKNYDKPDTYFVRIVLVRYGHFVSYSKFMRNIKHPYYKKMKVKPNKEYWEKRAFQEK